ncbi:pseudouridine synthase [Frigidibacter sp. ROC022]|uniref:pseudouridine synthase n=1 Tax=Frigidibacter sp. ROC022 TaxID=2971796 RepID=UPI00215AD037|nr:pseudouridine synthase [Frigidibacter sp. ROC022]MCR8726706.1 rRNA pseudouridine synthase [Frigidibacter sp. ROC022]
MTDRPADPPEEDPNAPPPTRPGERIAKHLARAGVASRREVERMVAAGRIAVNGAVITSPALNVGPKDRITVDGQPVADPEPPRLWLYHKPAGLVTTTRDELGRETIYDRMPEGLPRVMPVGRLDLTSEGLLLLTNDGGVKRRLELPATGWLRRYRVRVKGTPDDAMLAPLRRGIEIEGEKFQPMEVGLDRQQGANAWLTVAIREGRNREIRRAMEAIGLVVNRLIRISYGPFRLGTLKPGEVEEVRQKVLREQLGLEKPDTGAGGDGRRKAAAKPGARPGRKAGPKPAPKTAGRAPGDGPRGKPGRGKPGGGKPAAGGARRGPAPRRGPRDG